MNIYEGSKLLK